MEVNSDWSTSRLPLPALGSGYFAPALQATFAPSLCRREAKDEKSGCCSAKSPGVR